VAVRPPEEAKDLVGFLLVELDEVLNREGAAIGREQEVLVAPIFLPSEVPPVQRRWRAATD
jgi:hypothetical protein